MANIVYGVNGEGSGHSTRAKEVIAHLQRKNHNVHVVSFDRGLRNLSQTFEVTEIHGLRLTYVNNRVRYSRTVLNNLLSAPEAARSARRLSRLMEEWKIEVVITDFEPLSCQVAHYKGLPVISIDNQHCLTNTEVSYPQQYRRDAAAARLVTRLMTPRADAYLVTSFFPAAVKTENTFMFPPILRREVLETRPWEGDYGLVYVTSPAIELANALKSVPGRFVSYGFEREGEDGNIVFKKPSMDGFLKDLAGCKAVIGNTGFSLVSEALYLGKPYLAVPVKRQFEQIFNAYYLDKMGFGAWCEELNEERVEAFFRQAQAYRAKLAAYPREGNTALLTKLDELIAEQHGRTQAAATRARSD